MRRPGRDIPLSILGATAVAALLYVAVAVVAAGIPGAETGRSLDQVAALVMSRNGCVLFGLGAGVISMLGIINAHMLWGSRSIVMVSRDGWLPRGLARTSRSGAPVGALLLLTALGAIPAAYGLNVADVIRVAGLGATGSTILSVACAAIFAWREPQAYGVSPLGIRLPWLLAACALAIITQASVAVQLALRRMAGDRPGNRRPSRAVQGRRPWRGAGQSPVCYLGRIGKGSIRPTTNRYIAAPTRQRTPAAASGMRNDPWVMVSITPVKLVVTTPAMLEAKFWIPPIDATCPLVGATSPGSDQMLAAVKASDA
jgi:amino acid transporter